MWEIRFQSCVRRRCCVDFNEEGFGMFWSRRSRPAWPLLRPIARMVRAKFLRDEDSDSWWTSGDVLRSRR